MRDCASDKAIYLPARSTIRALTAPGVPWPSAFPTDPIPTLVRPVSQDILELATPRMATPEEVAAVHIPAYTTELPNVCRSKVRCGMGFTTVAILPAASAGRDLGRAHSPRAR